MAIDPGPKESAWIKINMSLEALYRPEMLGYSTNRVVRNLLKIEHYDRLVIEECIARKWAGRSISDTAFEAGRFAECSTAGFKLISRSAVRGHLSPRGNDSTIINKMVQNFEPELYDDMSFGRITRPKMLIEAKKRFFVGFHDDIWQAFALGVTYIDKEGGKAWEN